MNNKEKMPSRKRYEKKNPVVSFRTKEVWFDEFKSYLEQHSLTIGDFFRRSLKKQKMNYKKVKKRVYEHGFSDGRKQGFNEGYETGKKERFEERYEESYNKGCEDGYNKGQKIGYKIGHKDGLHMGQVLGFNEAERKFCIWYRCVYCNRQYAILPNTDLHKRIIDFLNYNGEIHCSCNQNIRWF